MNSDILPGAQATMPTETFNGVIASWQTDWALFAAHVAALHNSGKTDAEISALLAGRQVCWRGRIVRLGFNREYARGPQLEMPEVRCPLASGKVLVANFLAVSTEPMDEKTWQRCAANDSVSFQATTASTIGLFPAIRVSYDSAGNEAVLVTSVDSGRIATTS